MSEKLRTSNGSENGISVVYMHVYYLKIFYLKVLQRPFVLYNVVWCLFSQTQRHKDVCPALQYNLIHYCIDFFFCFVIVHEVILCLYEYFSFTANNDMMGLTHFID